MHQKSAQAAGTLRDSSANGHEFLTGGNGARMHQESAQCAETLTDITTNEH